MKQNVLPRRCLLCSPGPAIGGIRMTIYEYGDCSSKTVLIQPIGDHELESVSNEISFISSSTDRSFSLIAVKTDDWNNDLSPWKAPAVFADHAFEGNAVSTLQQIIALCGDPDKQYFIGGYSLAGLFALWAVSQTHIFKGAAVASPSVWFPHFTEYMKQTEIKSPLVYLSLGDKEHKTRDRTLAAVRNNICQIYSHLESKGVKCILEWNQGNHFKEADLRSAKAFSWLLNNQ